MKERLLQIISCPKCGKPFALTDGVTRNGEIYSGTLTCRACKGCYPVINYIPRIVENFNYSESWGKLWKETGEMIRDSYTGVPFYYNVIHGKYSEDSHARESTSPFGFEWPLKMEGESILEVGPGSGCCTEHLVKTGAHLVCVDMSNAVDTFSEDLLVSPNLDVLQTDINQPVLKAGYFDRIWLFQVLQHTPSPPNTLKTMYTHLKKGGEIAFTSYAGTYNPWYYRYTKRIDPDVSWRLISFWVPVILPMKYHLQKWFRFMKVGILAKIVAKVLEPVDPRNIYYNTLEGKQDSYVYAILWRRTGDKDVLMKHIILNTFDCITPEYTNCASHRDIEKWSYEAGFSRVKTWGIAGVRAKALK